MSIQLKEFRSIMVEVAKDKTEFQDVSKAVLETLAPGWKWYSRISKESQQNILNSLMEQDILNMIKTHLPEKFDFDRHSFSKEVIRKIKEKWVELY